MVHVVYTDKSSKEYEKIIQGLKTMVVRGATGRKIPHSRVFKDDTLYFMVKGSKKITATATVTSVENHVKLTDDQIIELFKKHELKLQLDDKQKKRWHKKCLVFVEFKNFHEIEPLEFDHQANMDDWLINEKIDDVVVGTSIPYNYEKSRF